MYRLDGKVEFCAGTSIREAVTECSKLLDKAIYVDLEFNFNGCKLKMNQFSNVDDTVKEYYSWINQKRLKNMRIKLENTEGDVIYIKPGTSVNMFSPECRASFPITFTGNYEHLSGEWVIDKIVEQGESKHIYCINADNIEINFNQEGYMPVIRTAKRQWIVDTYDNKCL